MKKTVQKSLFLAVLGLGFCAMGVEDDIANIPVQDFIQAKYNKLAAELREDATELKSDAVEEWAEFNQMVTRQADQLRDQYARIKNQLANYDEATASQKLDELKSKFESQIEAWKTTGALTAETAKQKAQLKLQEAVLELQASYAEFESRATSADADALAAAKSKLDTEKANLEAAVNAVCADYDQKSQELDAMLENRKAAFLADIDKLYTADSKSAQTRTREARRGNRDHRRGSSSLKSGVNSSVFGRVRKIEVRGGDNISIVVGADRDEITVSEGEADYRVFEDKLVIDSAVESAGLTLNLARPAEIELKDSVSASIECTAGSRLKLEVEESANAVVSGVCQSADIDVSDRAQLQSNGFTVDNYLKVESDNSSEVDMSELSADRLFVEVSENSSAVLSGTVNKLRYEIEDNARLNLDNLNVVR